MNIMNIVKKIMNIKYQMPKRSLHHCTVKNWGEHCLVDFDTLLHTTPTVLYCSQVANGVYGKKEYINTHTANAHRHTYLCMTRMICLYGNFHVPENHTE